VNSVYKLLKPQSAHRDRLLLTRVLSAILHLACLTALVQSGVASAPPSKQPNIILITVDTTRADRMGFLGSKLGLTPNLDILAHDSVVFTRAYSQVPLTAPSHATILTGTYPQFHHVDDFQVRLATDIPFVPAVLRAQGYHTAAFVGSMVLDPHAGFARGFDRGFDTYDAGFRQANPGEDRYQTTERRGGDVVAHALAWLDKNPDGPFFIWVHLYDAHDPYDPPEPYKTKYASALYDGEIAYADSAVGNLLAQLRQRRLYDAATITLMADHGEALGEHGEDTHGFFLYDETIHVPLVIKLPGGSAAGKRIENRVRLVDVMPTILQTAGIAIPKEVQGESLLGMMAPEIVAVGTASEPPYADRTAYAETDYPHLTYGWSPVRALRAGKYLYIKAPKQELYDQSTDPSALHNLSTTAAAVTSTLAAQLDDFRKTTSSSTEAPKSAVDPEAQAKLAALGYVATDDNAARSNSKDAGADPKDKIEIANMVHRTYLLVEAQRYQEAIPLLQQLIAKEPDTPLAYAQLGQSLFALKAYAKAIPVLRQATALRPEMTTPHYQLGVSLLETGDIAAAVPELEIVSAKIPQWEQPLLFLEMAYAQTDRMAESIKECEKVLDVDPENYGTNLLLGRVLTLTGKPTAALPRLKKAAALDPTKPEPHAFMAEAYEKLGQKVSAARERAAAKRLEAPGAE
jgi:arylsulfatase A-like enzyme